MRRSDTTDALLSAGCCAPPWRAVEELLKETDRARVRAETMGPAGWLKCPLRSTNKRFLLNTLRSTGLQRRGGRSAARGRPRVDSPDRSRDRSRSPPRDQRSNGGRSDHQHHHHRDSCSNRDKKRDRDKERRKDGAERDGHSRDKD
ncbi:hypothetical protein L3Q82_018117 [Scortum barcoo]|uniref:Uncharacterized protein n=1 Tax=Scortum barcoo TaxID=214431 RepID=A0ACB8VHY0_9TELE|nr:hypothetical protein L3Q82_018117 [Scortum barcoo]